MSSGCPGSPGKEVQFALLSSSAIPPRRAASASATPLSRASTDIGSSAAAAASAQPASSVASDSEAPYAICVA